MHGVPLCSAEFRQAEEALRESARFKYGFMFLCRSTAPHSAPVVHRDSSDGAKVYLRMRPLHVAKDVEIKDTAYRAFDESCQEGANQVTRGFKFQKHLVRKLFRVSLNLILINRV